MWLLAGVSADMNGKGASLDEGLVAILPCAFVRPLVGVYAEVPLQVGLAIEALVAYLPGALEGAWCLFGLHNFEQIHWCDISNELVIENYIN